MEYFYDEKFKGVLAKPNSTEEWLSFIWDIGVDYDGYNDVEGLKSIIDELVEAASEGLTCLREGHIFYDEEADRESCQKARQKATELKNMEV